MLCTSTPNISSSSKNINNTACFSRLSFLIFQLCLQNLQKKKKKKIVIQKSDKGNSVVTVDKADYLDKLKNLLNGTCKYEKKI